MSARTLIKPQRWARDEWARIRRQARVARMTPTEWIRRALLADLAVSEGGFAAVGLDLTVTLGELADFIVLKQSGRVAGRRDDNSKQEKKPWPKTSRG